MPYIQIRLRSPHPANTKRLGEEATRLMVEVMHKRREVTVVEVIETRSAWYAGGEAVDSATAYADIKITRGTNSEAEKSRLLAEFQTLLEQTVGAMAAPAYVVIHEIAASDWGYAGRSQASRLAGRL